MQSVFRLSSVLFLDSTQTTKQAGRESVPQDRRQTSRLIMRVPMRIRRLRKAPQNEELVESLNISLRGVYFATKTKFELKEDLELRLHMPERLCRGK